MQQLQPQAEVSEEERAKQEQQKKALEEAEEKRRALLSQILDGDARERLNRISLVKPERARSFEDYVIKLAQTGKLPGKINEETLVKMLEQMSGSSTKVKIQRKKSAFDSDEEADEDEDEDEDEDDFYK
ncbi:hypothetical protein FDP41_000674 [Naegleria fowleri]|uniref:Programmed cell death protein 5 n=1 Tax=Naegleria fowleri TaxID=5763 RepID=A0A6A5CHJ8_NAEFO|nr:uncharacterized protein FDP41_000674 [Naegleria fowleri]KAF0984775.1 hypothetical protein FDP41_000674 [Naegleria fowleri]CAG4707910.1 unnamed protein product [Naegleria fowleri]